MSTSRGGSCMPPCWNWRSMKDRRSSSSVAVTTPSSTMATTRSSSCDAAEPGVGARRTATLSASAGTSARRAREES